MLREFTIGRDDARKSDILLSGVHISGKHAILKIDNNGHLWIKDAASTNGTWVINAGTKRRVTGAYIQVSSGETLSLGGVEYGVDHLFSLLPRREAPVPKKNNEITQNMMRCVECGTPTPVGTACSKCRR